MSEFIIYHNPRCSKSRKALELLEQKAIKPEIIKYLETPPSVEELKKIVNKLSLNVKETIRTNEEIYKNKFKDKNLSEEQWLKVLVENPILIQRPIIVKASRAVIGRPPEKVLELL